MELYLYGGGGHAKVILDILHRQNRQVTGIVDDIVSQKCSHLHGVPLHPASAILGAQCNETAMWIVAIGDNAIRRKITEELAEQGYKFTSAIHPSAQIALGVKLEPGVVVMANSVINTDAKIGKHAIINTGATVDHDCVVEDYAHIAPNCSLCGQVHVGEGAFLGVGTIVKPSIRIGSWTICGAGSVLVSSLPPNVLAHGCPAKIQSP